CRMAVRICAVPAPRICCNGPMHSGRNSASAGRKVETEARALIPQKDLLRKRGCDGEQHRNRLPKKAFPGYPSPASRCALGPSSSHNDEGTSCPCCEYG